MTIETDVGRIERLAVELEDKYRFKNLPCPFLSGNTCTVYDVRPEDCRSYPHLRKGEFVFRLMGVVCNCAVCPIVYNVLERLKGEFWHLPRGDRMAQKLEWM
jgi:hypothetical protein